MSKPRPKCRPRRPVNPLATPASKASLAAIGGLLALALATHTPAPGPEPQMVMVPLTLAQVRTLNAMFEREARVDRAEAAILSPPMIPRPPVLPRPMPPRPRGDAPSLRLLDDVRALAWEAASAAKVDPHLFHGLLVTESGGRLNPGRSSKGACGVAQLMPRTAKALGVRRCDDPRESAFAGARYLGEQIGRFRDTTFGLVAYDMGPGATDRWIAKGGHWSQLPREARDYVSKVKINAAVSRRGTQLAME